ncbi:Uncharacterised protein [Vibrio cholerae]|nr:hypothetical protein DN39_3198 [Vibrio cholerae]CSI53963.1 Uncharacterised protein [Vibrio cholerae]
MVAQKLSDMFTDRRVRRIRQAKLHDCTAAFLW